MDIFDRIVNRQDKIAVIGLGYVGLPVAVALSEKAEVIGFDVSASKVESYKKGVDLTGDLGHERLRNCSVQFTNDESLLGEASFFIVAVPTPIGSGNVPDLEHVRSASRMVGRRLRKGAVVVYESTVYPGVTEEICLPILEQESGLKCGTDFKIGYSPERINPGDKTHRLENIVKIVSGMDDEALDIIAKVYELIIEAGVYRAESIKVAEAAKVIENAQRDINIAFMNELSMLFHQMDIETKSVLAAAGTKWNFLKFSPGLVGGHCIGIDPYYLTYKAEDSGYYSKIILAGRHINDGMGKYVAQQIVKKLMRHKQDLSSAAVGILGLSYKEDSPDIRNTKVIDMIKELDEYGVRTVVCDPVADPEEVAKEYAIALAEPHELRNLSLVAVTVPHHCFAKLGPSDFDQMFIPGAVKSVMDIKGVFDKETFRNHGYDYWSL
ncbi:nucleotide sugar dehydrogenase [Paenibacillus nanensis]|uniref:Nucleotide sugar dehydrogenase n=1 Tax=Paenibacillus nanensis TaxID=393251 RepID=A0A3A1UM53_9BACL|nr:nucleotide sugar dehydrogenase [Paenibacillus nanensis]RIX49240.1 nucleotide sugar dehydrogenase [Paenibacillus nanensis]